MFRLIRGYFVFMIMAFMVVFISQSQTVKSIYADVFETFSSEEFVEPNFIVKQAALKKSEKTFESLSEDSYVINLYFENDIGLAYAIPGEKGKEVMRMIIKTDEHNLKLDYIKFRIHGMESGYLDSLHFVENEEVIKAANFEKGYAIFDDLNIELEPNTRRIISISADLSEQVSSGKRLRLDVENEEDIEIYVDDILYSVRDYYPIYGKYLSIVRDGV
ncbi:hypothetical protein ACFL21_03495 [Patescibacteria group bacterium]